MPDFLDLLVRLFLKELIFLAGGLSFVNVKLLKQIREYANARLAVEMRFG